MFDIYTAGNQLILSLLRSYSETDLMKLVASFSGDNYLLIAVLFHFFFKFGLFLLPSHFVKSL